MGPPPIFRGAPPFLMPQAQPGLLGPGVPVPMAPMTSGVRLPLQPPLGLPPITMGMPGQPLPIQHTISAPPMGLEPPKNFQPKVPVISAADMKVATTVFVGNISDKATDTLVRQILLVSSFANFDTRICVLTGSSVGTPFNCTMLSQLLTFDL